MSETPSFFARLGLAFRVAFDPALAARVLAPPALSMPEAPPGASPPRVEPSASRVDPSALVLLALLQREGRLVDFLEEDVSGARDADIGAAARSVHEGCRKALRAHVALVPVRGEDEGASVTLEAGFDATSNKLVGNVRGGAPYRGVVRHRGWRAASVSLPTLLAGADPTVIAPAEIEA